MRVAVEMRHPNPATAARGGGACRVVACRQISGAPRALLLSLHAACASRGGEEEAFPRGAGRRFVGPIPGTDAQLIKAEGGAGAGVVKGSAGVAARG